MKPVGKVTHYYRKAGVAIVELAQSLKVGDRVRIERGDQVFDQNISSLHKDLKSIEHAGKGDVVGMKVDQKVKEGSLVALLEEGG
ncbi:MAG: translation elongation factor-like protein [bacterium]|nr:translation elongation factor-like protein [bacterium]